MSAVVIQRCHRLAESLTELKARVRSAVATELAAAVGAAVRDVLVVALVDRLVAPPRPAAPRVMPSRTVAWRDEEDRERDRWDDPWGEPDEYDHDRTPVRSARVEPAEGELVPAVPAAAVAVGVTVGRWWLAREGSIGTAVGLGVLATSLGFAGGPLARAALAVLAAVGDLLAAESSLARLDPF